MVTVQEANLGWVCTWHTHPAGMDPREWQAKAVVTYQSWSLPAAPGAWAQWWLAQLALHNPHIWANSLKPVCFLCFLLFWCPLLPFIETGTLKIYTKMVLYMKNEFLTSNTPHGV